jgi:hypothetical protein
MWLPERPSHVWVPGRPPAAAENTIDATRYAASSCIAGTACE